MAQYFNNLFGGSKSSAAPIPSDDADFADFANAPEAAVTGTVTTQVVTPLASASSTATTTAVPFTKWYNVHERHSLDEFRAEGLILILMVVVLGVHFFGATRNRSKARGWIKAHQKTLASEFAVVGFGRVPATAVNAEDPADVATVLDALAKKNEEIDPKLLIKENSLFEFSAYATGRQNVAFMDIKLNLIKRFNPFMVIAESILAFFIDSMATPEDTVEATLYPFDGKEALTIPGYATSANNGPKSSYDGFVWAIVNKERMKDVRDERFDVSITFTKDNAKLPPWLTVMSESAEITNQLLTPELIQAAEAAGEQLDYLIISDQPTVKPTTLEETEPKKRVFLKYRLPSNGDYTPLVPIFSYFVHSIDALVQLGRLRPEVQRKLKSIREDVVKQIKKADEEEKAEERAIERERVRKAKRDAELNALDAKAQKKYLERERERELRKSAKKSTVRA